MNADSIVKLLTGCLLQISRGMSLPYKVINCKTIYSHPALFTASRDDIHMELEFQYAPVSYR